MNVSLQVNGVDVASAKHDNVADLIKRSGEFLSLTVISSENTHGLQQQGDWSAGKLAFIYLFIYYIIVIYVFILIDYTREAAWYIIAVVSECLSDC